ncbi:MAG TPA: hypothetical protein VH333_21805 [Pseudonocardiaceae bacterium]|nr:hypothetical protein [Pseudonocardiaceae bacterium]
MTVAVLARESVRDLETAFTAIMVAGGVGAAHRRHHRVVRVIAGRAVIEERGGPLLGPVPAEHQGVGPTSRARPDEPRHRAR